jgi:exoribonuclease-2
MQERGMATGLNHEQEVQLDSLPGPAPIEGLRDLRDLLWCSIDNDDSLDLDQLTVWVPTDNGDRILVAVADVDTLVPKGSPLDRKAWQNTTTVYTAAQIYYMIPERLSTNLTSLNFNADRAALIIQMDVGPKGEIGTSEVFLASVRNHARLSYNAVAQWLEGRGPMPTEVAAVPSMDEQLQKQDDIAQRLRTSRIEHGALELDTLEPQAVMLRGDVVDLTTSTRNVAKQLIEDFMVAANGTTARFLRDRGRASLRRVVRTPKRWDRIVALAAEHGTTLPATPDSAALGAFVIAERHKDPLRFPDLCLAIVKLMGPGEYTVEQPGQTPTGHFGLAVRDYSHSTAPNRRYPDLITHRLLKAALADKPSPYSDSELEVLAEHCTERENDAQKVERQVHKSAAAQLLSHHIGQRYDGIVTGVNKNGTWVRVLAPPVEGKLVGIHDHVDVGARVRVKLVDVSVERGFIDFIRVPFEH